MAPIPFPKLSAGNGAAPCPQLLAGFAVLTPGLTFAARYRNVDYPAGFASGSLAVGTTARSAMLQIRSGALPRASISVSNIVVVSVNL